MADIVKKQPVTQTITQFANVHSNDIFLGLGIALGVGAVGLAIKGTVKAVRLIDEEKAKDPDKKLTKKEVLKKVWKCYIPMAVVEAASIACGINSGKISNKSIAAATVMCKAKDEVHSLYKQAATEVLGEKKEKKMEEAATQLYLDKHPLSGRPLDTGKGDVLFKDSYYGWEFKSSINYVDTCVNRVNEMINHGDAVSMNDWYDLLGLNPVGAGYNEGWSMDATGLMSIFRDTGIASNDEPCFVIKYHVAPTNKFMR